MSQQQLLRGLPSKPGVYIYRDEKGKILYIGKAKDLKKRVSSYFSKTNLDAKTIQLVSHIKKIDHIIVNSEIEAFLLEAELIKKHTPYYNIRFVDDKSYPFIAIGKDDNPGVTIVRNTSDKNFYYGPYVDARAVKTVLKILRKIFPYQSVKNHQRRQCLYYHLGLCPCVSVHPEKLDEYKKNLSKIRKFLTGQTTGVIKDLQKEQKAFIKNEEFEQAQELQKKIEYIEHITSDTYEPFRYLEQPDFYFKRISEEVESLQDELTLYYPELKKIKRIECYDISNFQGKEATGSMVVFTNGDKDSKEYRRFKIKTKSTPDDFHMMKEVLSRRFKRDGWEDPDLIVIDGGKGQVGAALQALTYVKKEFPVIGLAKREETIVVPQKTFGNKLEFIEVKLPKSTPAVNLLRRIRDEAHRFAITYHRLLRKKKFLPS